MLSTLAAAATKTGAHANDAAAKASGGLPQLNVADFAPQLIWLAGIFCLLYLLMSKLVIPRVGGVLQERSDRITKDLTAAQRLKGETEQALANYEKAMSEAKARAQKISQENRDTLNGEINKERAAIEARITAQAVEADKRIMAARTRAMGSVNEIAGDSARAIVSQLIGHEVSAADALQAVAQAVAGKLAPGAPARG
jgi:F-type H+-transporting ATPase subunit b